MPKPKLTSHGPPTPKVFDESGVCLELFFVSEIRLMLYRARGLGLKGDELRVPGVGFGV